MAKTVITGVDAPKWLVDQLISLNECISIESYRRQCQLTVTDLFGNPLEVGQQVLYFRHIPRNWSNNGSEVCECKILDILEEGELVLRNSKTGNVSTISSFTPVYEGPGMGTARYMQLYVRS